MSPVDDASAQGREQCRQEDGEREGGGDPLLAVGEIGFERMEEGGETVEHRRPCQCLPRRQRQNGQ